MRYSAVALCTITEASDSTVYFVLNRRVISLPTVTAIRSEPALSESPVSTLLHRPVAFNHRQSWAIRKQVSVRSIAPMT